MNLANQSPAELLSQRIAAELEALESTIDGLKVLSPTGRQQSGVRQAIKRARSALQSAGEPLLTIALAGGTGVGKSTVINALAGAAIAEVSDHRPTTDRATVYVHRGVHPALLPAALGTQARTVVHDRAELRHKVLIDTPDLDSVRTDHRAYTRRLLTGADLVLLVTSSEKYYDEKVWSVIDEEQAFKPFAVLLNKIDLHPHLADRQAIADDLGQILSRQGLDGARVYPLHAAFHAQAGEQHAAHLAEGDQFEDLTAWIQQGLLEADIERIKSRQAAAVVGHLQRQVWTLMPANPAADVERARADTQAATEQWLEQLGAGYDRAFGDIESAIRPAITVAGHERFSGLFRAYLAVVDGARFGLRWLLATCLHRPQRSLSDLLARGLSGPSSGLETTWPNTRSAICQAFAHHHLPSVALESRLTELSGEQLARGIESAVLELAEEPGAWAVRRSQVGLRVFNFFAAALPVGFLCWVGWRLSVEFYFARYHQGPPLIWHALALGVLLMLALHGVSGLLFPTSAAKVAKRVRQQLRQRIREQIVGWLEPPLDSYRHDLLADCRSLSDRLSAIRSHQQELTGSSEPPEAEG